MSCQVPVENLIGRENEGFKYIMDNFNHERWGIAVQVRRERTREREREREERSVCLCEIERECERERLSAVPRPFASAARCSRRRSSTHTSARPSARYEALARLLSLRERRERERESRSIAAPLALSLHMLLSAFLISFRALSLCAFCAWVATNSEKEAI